MTHLPLSQIVPARLRARGSLAAAVATAALLAACERAPEVTAPSAAVPVAVAGLAGHLDVATLAALADPTPCELNPFPSVVAGDGGPRGGGVLVAAGPTTSTTGVAMYDIGSPTPGARATAVDVTNAGLVVANVVRVVGGVAADTAAWVWSGAFTQVPALAGATHMIATDVSNNATPVVVGYARFAGGVVKSWRYTGGSTAEITGATNLEVRGINDAGMLTGSAGDGAAAIAVRSVDGGATWQTIASARSSGWAINALGAVAGYVYVGGVSHAAFWAPGSATATDLGLLAGTNAGSQAFALNDYNEVVGVSLVAAGLSAPTPRAFYWPGEITAGVPAPLVQIGGPGFDVPSAARDINNSRVVVGYARSTISGTHAWAWVAPGGPIADLGKRPDACSSFAYGINEECKIVGHSLIDATGMPQDLARWDGYACPPRYSLGDRVWTDLDADGQQDAGEAGINGVTVSISTWSNVPLGTATTAGDGTYGFSNLPAGTYKVCVTAGVPAGHAQTYDLDGLATPNCATASVGPSRTDVDFGYTPPRYSIGDLVWYDANGDGAATPGAGEAGIANVKVTIAGPGGYSAATTTSAGGIYGFGGLLAGSYTVCVDASNMAPGGPLAGHAQTYDLDGLASANCATASVGPSRSDVDFSYTRWAGKIGDYTWIDANGNGRQDAGEPALAGVTLTLSGAASGTLTSTAAGAYLFTDLGPGAYTVAASAPAGWLPTTPNAAGTTNANDSNTNPSSTTLTFWSSQDLTLDFGFVPKAGGGQGCTPGYWKQAQHFDSWKWYAPSDMVDAVFGVTYRSALKNNPNGPLTLLEGLELNGNDDSEALIRHGVAALLNSVYQSGVSFPYTAPQVISMVRTALASGDPVKWNATKDILDTANNAGCPLN